MESNIIISWHNVDSSEAVEAEVRKRYAKLLPYANDITTARLSIDQPHHPSHKPHSFRVLLEVHIPGVSIVSQQPTTDHEDVEKTTDVYSLIHRAFDATRRQIIDHNKLHQGNALRHNAARHAEHQLDPDQVVDSAD